jgi:hypothetical protein
MKMKHSLAVTLAYARNQGCGGIIQDRTLAMIIPKVAFSKNDDLACIAQLSILTYDGSSLMKMVENVHNNLEDS